VRHFLDREVLISRGNQPIERPGDVDRPHALRPQFAHPLGSHRWVELEAKVVKFEQRRVLIPF
jgi:hypothetical protein